MDTLADAQTAVSNSGVVDWDWNTGDNDSVLDSLADYLYRSDSEELTDDILRGFIADVLGQEPSDYDLAAMGKPQYLVAVRDWYSDMASINLRVSAGEVDGSGEYESDALSASQMARIKRHLPNGSRQLEAVSIDMRNNPTTILHFNQDDSVNQKSTKAGCYETYK